MGKMRMESVDMTAQNIERLRIHGAREHFKALSSSETVYDVAGSYQSLLDLVTR